MHITSVTKCKNHSLDVNLGKIIFCIRIINIVLRTWLLLKELNLPPRPDPRTCCSSLPQFLCLRVRIGSEASSYFDPSTGLTVQEDVGHEVHAGH